MPDCDACASGLVGLYRDGCLRCAARKYVRLYTDRERRIQTRRWKDTLDSKALADVQRFITEERERCLTV
jgi:hypothetical protein